MTLSTLSLPLNGVGGGGRAGSGGARGRRSLMRQGNLLPPDVRVNRRLVVNTLHSDRSRVTPALYLPEGPSSDLHTIDSDDPDGMRQRGRLGVEVQTWERWDALQEK